MKKVIRTIVAAALLFVSTNAMALDAKLNLTANNDKSITVRVLDNTEEAYITIVDADYNLIYSEEIKSNKTFYKRFDFSKLENGSYEITMENKLTTTVYLIDVTSDAIVVNDKIDDVKPAYRRVENKVYLNLLNTDLNEVAISVFDEANRTVFAETIDSALVVEKAFNFVNAHAGVYTIKVKTDKKTFYEVVSVK